jgi:hypothetical protein
MVQQTGVRALLEHSSTQLPERCLMWLVQLLLPVHTGTTSGEPEPVMCIRLSCQIAARLHETGIPGQPTRGMRSP